MRTDSAVNKGSLDSVSSCSKEQFRTDRPMLKTLPRCSLVIFNVSVLGNNNFQSMIQNRANTLKKVDSNDGMPRAKRSKYILASMKSI